MGTWIADHWSRILFVVIIVVIFLLFLFFWRNKYFKQGTKNFIRDIHALFEEGNRIRTYWILAVIMLIPFLLYVFLLPDINDSIDKANAFFAITGYLMTIVGILISASVLIVVDKKRTKTLRDYLRVTLDIIKDSKRGDTLYIISPTFCAGITEHRRTLDKLYDRMTASKNNDVVFKCAFLKTSEITNNWSYIGDINNINIDDAMNDDDLHWKMINKFFIPQIEQKVAKVNVEDDESANSAAKKERVKTLVNEKLELIKDYHNKIKLIDPDLIYLNEGYLQHDMNNPNIFWGFYATVNVTQGQYYLGSFFHDGEKTSFRGSFFEIEGICKSMEDMLSSFRDQYKSIQ